MEYNFREIEKKWQQKWVEQKTYKVTEDESKQKFYVLNMFPYPSGAGLHVGHPLGYIASDIYARYKRLQGFNVLNPMGYDAYGLPAEQYAIQTGQHPAITTVNNITTSTVTVSNWIKSGSRSIGTARYAPATPTITTGRNGLSKRCSIASIATLAEKRNPSKSLSHTSKKKEPKGWTWLARKN